MTLSELPPQSLHELRIGSEPVLDVRGSGLLDQIVSFVGIINQGIEGPQTILPILLPVVEP